PPSRWIPACEVVAKGRLSLEPQRHKDTKVFWSCQRYALQTKEKVFLCVFVPLWFLLLRPFATLSCAGKTAVVEIGI
nr:hypothetical protein [Endozoicomonas sp.]